MGGPSSSASSVPLPEPGGAVSPGGGGRVRPPKRRAVAHAWDAFCYAMQGYWTAMRTEAAFRQEFVIGLFLLGLSFYLPFSLAVRLLLNSLWLLLLAAELFNTAIEAVVDLVTPEWHALAKRAKDMAACAVLLVLTALFACWTFALLHYLEFDLDAFVHYFHR